jgi:hypothetical protein
MCGMFDSTQGPCQFLECSPRLACRLEVIEGLSQRRSLCEELGIGMLLKRFCDCRDGGRRDLT